MSERQNETKKVFEDKVKVEAGLLLYTKDYISPFRGQGGIECGLKGIYQKKNIPTVILAAAILNELGLQINASSIAKGLKDVIKLTGLRGRWEMLSKKPMIVADIAHNEAGIKEIFRQIKTIKYKNLHIVFGTVNDKDIHKILPLLPPKAKYYFCKANIPRALDSSVLAYEAEKYALKGEAYKSVKTALTSAKKNASANDFILITGSAFVVAEAL